MGCDGTKYGGGVRWKHPLANLTAEVFRTKKKSLKERGSSYSEIFGSDWDILKAVVKAEVVRRVAIGGRSKSALEVHVPFTRRWGRNLPCAIWASAACSAGRRRAILVASEARGLVRLVWRCLSVALLIGESCGLARDCGGVLSGSWDRSGDAGPLMKLGPELGPIVSSDHVCGYLNLGTYPYCPCSRTLQSSLNLEMD